MDLMSMLFGTEGGFQKTDALSPEQQKLNSQLIQQLLGNLGQAAPQYEGQYTPAVTSQQELSMQQLARALQGEGAMGQALTGSLKGTSPETREEYFRTNIQQPAQEQYQDVQTQLANQFVGSGNFWGGAREDLQQEAATDFAKSMAAERANLAWQTEQSDQQRALQGVELSNALSQALYGMGAQQQGMQQQGLDRQYQEYVRTRPENSPYLQAAFQALGIPVQQTAYQPGTEGAFGPILGTVGKLLAGMATGGTGFFA